MNVSRTPPTPAIQARDLRRVFRVRSGDVVAVDHLDLTVHSGEVFGLLGPNGAGKSTTIRILTTLLTPTAGRAWVAGFDVARAPQDVRHRIGYVAQRGSAFPVQTGREELVMQARVHGAPREQARRRAAELIDRFGLGEVADRRVGTWSGGQRRRLDLAIGLAHRPQVLFLDEPTLGLDPQSRASLWDEIRQLRDEGTTVLLTTHYLDEADALADRLAIIDHGRVVAAGTPADLKRELSGDMITLGAGVDAERMRALLDGGPRVRAATVVEGTVRLHVDDGPQAIVAAMATLDRAGLVPGSVALTQPSLDDVFLTRTGRSLREDGPGPQPAGVVA